MLQVALSCDNLSGHVVLRSKLSDTAVQTTHLRGSITCSLAMGPVALAAPPSSISPLPRVVLACAWRMALTSRAATTAADRAQTTLLADGEGRQQQPGTASGGCLAALDTVTAQSGATTEYRTHPALADSAMHTGALNPAAPQDGLTRVPAALGAYTAASNDAGALRAEHWASVDSGATQPAKSMVNTYR